jgi:hypothetical protein
MVVQILIEMTPTGQVNVTGPVDNKVLCFGLLEAAKDAVREYAEQNAKRIVPATGITLAPPNGR